MHRSRFTTISLLGVLAGSAAFSAALTTTMTATEHDARPGERVLTIEPDASQRQAMSMAVNISEAFAYAAQKIEPSVVHITTSERSRGGRGAQELGSGVIVNDQGYILTNNHVVEHGRYISVRLADGRELPAKVVGTFAETDIAVLRIEADDLVPASFGDSEGLKVGQWVLAVGSPFGFDQTVTAGIVSAKGRGSFGPDSENRAVTRLQEFIQTDAAINPGNSGGPLVDLNGHVVGINTAIISRTGSNNGLGFAIPADIAQSVMEQIIDTGRVQRGWLGISMDPLAPTKAHELGIKGGVVINEVMEEGPAEEAGLREGDIIVALGGRTTENTVRLGNAIMLTKPNAPVEIRYIRDGEQRTAEAVVTDRDEGMLLAQGGAKLEPLGISVTRPLRANFRRGSVPGFIVAGVDSDSPAGKRGLEPDDFIYQVDGQSFDSTVALARYVSMIDAGEPIRISFIRDGAPMYVEVAPQP